MSENSLVIRERCTVLVGVEPCRGHLDYRFDEIGRTIAFCPSCEARAQHEAMRKRYPKFAAMEDVIAPHATRFQSIEFPAGRAAERETTLAASLTRKCQLCRTETVHSPCARYCWSCRETRQREKIQRWREANRPQTGRSLACVTCGAELKIRAFYCGSCGEKRRRALQKAWYERMKEIPRPGGRVA